MPSLLARLGNAYRALRGKQGQSIPSIELAPYQGWGMPANFKPQESLAAYDDNVYLHRAVLAIALEGARTDFKLATVADDGEIDYVKSHQAAETLKLPQPTRGGKSMLTAMDLKMVTFMHMLLNGEAFWHLEKRLKIGGSPLFVNPLLPQHMYVDIAGDGEVLEYIYRPGHKEFRLDPMDVVHFKLIDPQNMYRGNSPIQALRYSLDTHKKADEMNTRRLDNSAVPPGVLASDQAIVESERIKLGQQWQAGVGGVRNAGKVPVMPQGLHFEKIADSNQEMQFIEGKNLTRDEILAMYAIGLDLLGKTDSKTRANAEASIFSFQRFGVLPFLEKFADTLNNDYLPAFPSTEGMTFVFADPVPENMEDKRANADSLFAGGALTPNERRKMFNLEPLNLPGMDTPYMDLGKMPVGEEPEPEPELDEEPEDEPDRLAA